jgi:hypothetical protein
MQINVIYDPSVASAPAGFQTGIMDAVNYLEKVFTNPISVTIDVGYGEVDGFQLASNALGESYYPVGEPETYSAVISALKAENAPGASTLPSNSPFPANYILYLSPAETKALGLPLSVPVGGVDGYVGFSSAPNVFGYANGSASPANEYYFIGVVEHEITEIMGRVSLLPNLTPDYSVIDLFRYLSPGVRDTAAGGINSTAYFSINNGVANLGSWNNNPNNGDLADWYPGGPAPSGNDAFNDYSSPGVINIVSASDIMLMRALGWTTTSALVTTTNVVSWKNSVSSDFAVAANWNSGTIPGSGDIAAISSGGTYTVSSSQDETVDGLTTATGATLDIISGAFTITNGTGLGANAGLIQIGLGATLVLEGDVSNIGRTKAIGGTIELDNATVSGGYLRSLGSNALIETTTDSLDTIKAGATIVSGSVVDVASGSTLTLRGDTIGTGVLVDVMSGGTAVVSGTVTSLGTLLASDVGSTVDIIGVLNGGLAEVGNGIVDIINLSREAVVFQSGGTGGLLLADALGYTGRVSGFGTNTTQFIDLTNVIYDPGVSCIYTPNSINPTQRGVLTVTSSGQIVAKIHMIGDYTTTNFTLSADSSGDVKITDPPVAAQQPVNAPGSTGASLNAAILAGTGPKFGIQNALDLSEIGFDPHSTNHLENISGNLAALSVADGTHTTAVPLVGIVTASDNHGTSLIPDA